jgi:hypothetical protein
MKLLTVQLPLFSLYFIPLRSKQRPQKPVLYGTTPNLKKKLLDQRWETYFLM